MNVLKPAIKCYLYQNGSYLPTSVEKIIIFNYLGFLLIVINLPGCLLNRRRALGFPTTERLMSISLAWLTVSGKL